MKRTFLEPKFLAPDIYLRYFPRHRIKFRVFSFNYSQNERGKSAFKILTGRSTEKRPLGRPRRRWENNIRVDLKKKRYRYKELG